MPVPLAAALADIARRVRAAPGVWVGTDFDGTLARYTDDPDEATLTAGGRDALAALAACARTAVAVVSGRDLPNLRGRIGLAGIGYAGNHGLEIELPGGDRFEHPAAAGLRPEMARLAGELRSAVAGLPGAWVQDKGLTLTVHYRRTPEPLHPTVGKVVQDVVFPPSPSRGEGRKGFRVRPGVLNWEVRPPADWDKGSAVAWLRDRQSPAGALAFFLGDDHTDEDAFRALPGGVTVLVGPVRATAAAYHAADPAAVVDFLRWLHGVL